MSCNIKILKGITLNGSKRIYGGALQSFSMSMGGLSSQIRATASLVADSGLTTPANGDDVTVNIGGANLKMQVGGYNFKSSAAGATTLTLNLFDTSNRFLDNFHITLAEEDAQDGVAPNNVAVLGRKFGPLPEAALAPRGVVSATPDTKFGDLRAFYEKEMPSCPEETDEARKQRVDDGVRGAAGKTLYTGADLAKACGNTVAFSPTFNASRNDLFDFRGTQREVLVQYANAVGAQTYWDMETEEVRIVANSSSSAGFAKLAVIGASCEVISASESVDYTNTLGKGAIGQVTSSFQGENQSSSGREMSRFLTAVALDPVYKYSKCKNKKNAVLEDLTFNKDVLKAIQAAVNPKIYAAYALQAGVAGVDMGAVHPLVCKKIAEQCKELTWTTKNEAKKVVKKTRETNQAEWEVMLPLDDKPGYSANKFLEEYYKGDDQNECTAQLAIVKLADLPEAGDDDPAVMIASEANAMAEGKNFNGPGKAPQDTKKDAQTPSGWNTNQGADPYKSLGRFAGGKFEEGKIMIQYNPFFDSIVGPGGLQGENDVLRQYLLAIQKFKNRFYVIKKDGLKKSDGCDVQSIGVQGKSYGYYLSSDSQGSPLSFEAMEGYKVVGLNPFTPLGECSCGELVALAQTLAMMYLPVGKPLSDVMGRRPDPDNPVEGMDEGKSGAAVIDFIYALQSDGKIDPPEGKKQGLEAFFLGEGGDAEPVRRAKFAEEGDAKLTMYLVVVDPEGKELADIPQISFTANADQREGGNPGQLEPAKTTAGPAQKAADTLLIDLGGTLSGVNDIKGLKGLSQKVETNDSGVIMWGLNTIVNQKLVDLNSTVPAGFFAVNGDNLMEDEAFIPPASLYGAGPDTIRVWFRVQGAQNSFGNSSSGEFTLAASVSPKGNCWKQKYDFGISVNGADIGRDNITGQSWPANSLDMANPYSGANRGKMLKALYTKLNESAISDEEHSISRSMTFLMLEEGMPSIPSMEEGLESLQISISGNKTEVSLTVGNSTVKGAQRALAERMVQSPSTMYRPGNIMGDSVFEQTTPRFQNMMKGR